MKVVMFFLHSSLLSEEHIAFLSQVIAGSSTCLPQSPV